MTFLFVAFDGETIAIRVSLSFSNIDNEYLFNETPVTETGVTVILHVAFFPPSLVVTEIVALPAPFAVTTPSMDTVATDVLLDVQVTVLSVALGGVTVAYNACESPTFSDNDVVFSVTPKTAMFFDFTVT